MKPRRFKTEAELAAFIKATTGRALHMLVLHDEACTPTACTCRPEYEVEDLTVETFVAGAKAEAAWRKDRTS